MAHHTHATMDENYTSAQAHRYDRTAGLARGMYRRIAQDAGGALPAGSRIVDIGTGPGRLVAAIASLRPDVRVIGVDPAPAMAARAELRLARFDHAEVRVATAEELPFDGAQVDLVVSSFALHHWRDPRQGGAEIRRVLAPTGSVRIYDMAFADFAGLQAGLRPSSHPVPVDRFALTPLGFPAIHRLSL
ncbi:class I SAM-dependent methyltransferase [Microbacterium sp.]|uniref:class I SAM-dependent methyltransferase n=1 Tax=Microbacterium sp. TaxID=51671 RepID=UPI003A8B86D7